MIRFRINANNINSTSPSFTLSKTFQNAPRAN